MNKVDPAQPEPHAAPPGVNHCDSEESSAGQKLLDQVRDCLASNGYLSASPTPCRRQRVWICQHRTCGPPAWPSHCAIRAVRLSPKECYSIPSACQRISTWACLGLPALTCGPPMLFPPLIAQYQASPGLVWISPRRRCSGWWRQKSSSANTVRTLPSPPPGCPQSKPSRRGCSRVALLITVPFQDPSHCSGR